MLKFLKLECALYYENSFRQQMLCNSLLKTMTGNTHKQVSQIHEIQCVPQRKDLYLEFTSSHDPVSLAGKHFLDQEQVKNILAAEQLTHLNLQLTPLSEASLIVQIIILLLTRDIEEMWQ